MSKTTNKFSTEVRARAVRMVIGHEGDHPSRWAKEFGSDPKQAFPGLGQMKPEQLEIDRLR